MEIPNIELILAIKKKYLILIFIDLYDAVPIIHFTEYLRFNLRPVYFDILIQPFCLISAKTVQVDVVIVNIILRSSTVIMYINDFSN